jgi:hypothetical protein
MRITSGGKTTFAFKLKMLGAEPSYPTFATGGDFHDFLGLFT